MKLQQLAVVFIVIILPISLVINMYVDNNQKVIAEEAAYDDILLSATNDAVYAYQMNTLRNGYSTVNDSKIRDISATVNTFYNSLASGMGSSGYRREDLQGYIPAMLFTLYDGYYLYGDYQNAVTITDGKQEYLTVNSNELASRNGVKPFIYYTCEYTSNSGNLDIVINYTLDNYITMMGVNGSDVINLSFPLVKLIPISSLFEQAPSISVDTSAAVVRKYFFITFTSSFWFDLTFFIISFFKFCHNIFLVGFCGISVKT